MTTAIQVPQVPEHIRKRFRIESEVAPNRYARILLSGIGKQGKTAIIGTASRNVLIDDEPTLGYNNVLYLQYDDHGSDTFLGMNVLVDKIEPKDFDELKSILEFANSSNAEQYDVVAVDTYSMMQVKLSRAINPNGILDIRQYNELFRQCREINDLFLPIKKHVIVACHTSVKADPLDTHKKLDEKEMIVSPQLDGKMAHLLSSYFSVHGLVNRRTNDVDVKFNQAKTETGTRFRMKQVMTNPTFKDLLKEMQLSTRLYNNINWKHDNQGFTPELVKK